MSAYFLAPLVIAQRLPQLWFEALHPNPMVNEESHRAVAEKVEAFSESMIAAQLAAIRAPMSVALEMMRGHSPFAAVMGAQKSIAKAASRPIEKRLRHNMRRLSRR